MKNYLKVSLLCITSLTLYGGERKSGDRPTKAASFAGTPSPKITSTNPLAKSAPIRIPKGRADDELEWNWKAKRVSQKFSAGDYLGLCQQSCSPSSYDDSSR